MQTPLAASADLTAFGRDLGSGVAFPASGPSGSVLRRGDVFLRTDLGTNGSLWTYVGGASGSAGWTHKGPIICTAATRPAVTYAGLRIFETDTKRSWTYDGTGWAYTAGPARVVKAQTPAVQTTGITVGTAYIADSVGDITLPARAGEWVRISAGFVADSGTGDLRTDVATIVNSAIVNYVSNGGASGLSNGIGGWTVIGGRYENLAGSILYQVQAGDLDANGNLTLRLLHKVTSGSRIVLQNVADAIVFAAEVVGG